MKKTFALIAVAVVTLASLVLPQAHAATDGQVSVPLSDYTELMNQPRPAPAAYAIGAAKVEAAARERDGRMTATVEVAVQIEIFEDEWTLVPILDGGVALAGARVEGKPVRLVERGGALYWSSRKAGVYDMRLRYDVESAGNSLPLAVPRAASTSLALTWPEAGADLSVAPVADLSSETRDGTTRLAAAIPPTSTILVSWRDAARQPYAISRASYLGTLGETAITWKASFEVEMFDGGRIALPVMPMGVTLSDVRVDGEPATLLERDDHFATMQQGRGMHRVEVDFEIPVAADGPPRASFRIPRVPVSRFDLVLPGRKELKVSPGADVRVTELADATQATTFIPMSDRIAFSWTEAIPEDLRGEMRANASLYHTVFAEEGVLHGDATVAYEITHGEADRLELEIPEDAQVNRIAAADVPVSDWVVAKSETPGRKRIEVFLGRPATGSLILDVSYEKLLGASMAEPVGVPLLNAVGVHRQRGMVALLSGPELALEPESAAGATRVGENQLPADIRNRIVMTIAHTFKYIEDAPDLRVRARTPERKQGQFDARVDTLISLGDVTMKGSATVEVDVKSGAILALRLLVPDRVNILGVAGPSLRDHAVVETPGGQAIDLAFTRDMDGQFRVEVNYEWIMEGGATDVAVPTVSVEAAEVEHGRIAVEALTAVEVQASTVEGLSGLDINELPQQLVLKTSNPILLAYRYVNANTPFRLALTITRHKEIDVQVAAIERADYKSLVTRDGLSVTTARLTVRNSRRQFLRLALPPESKVWSVFVDGKPEKPAYATDSGREGEAAVLIRMINSAQGFPVDIVYETPIQGIDTFGRISGQLPRPDMVVTQSQWDVYLPTGPNYVALDGPMDLVFDGYETGSMGIDMGRASEAYKAQIGQPLRINVPSKGVLFRFEKLYASQSAEEAGFAIRYVSDDVNRGAILITLACALLLWIAGAAAMPKSRLPLGRRGAAVLAGISILLLAGAIGYLETDPQPAVALAVLVAVALVLWRIWRSIVTWRRERARAKA